MLLMMQNDKIGILSHSAGTITMAASKSIPAYLTIGGRQYRVITNLTVASTSLLPTVRYQIYAVQTAGTPQLVLSTRENSVGPIGFLGWKLIGAMYSNFAGGFAGFCTIDGTPTTEWMLAGAVPLTSTNGNAVKGATRTVDELYFMVNGETVSAKANYKQTTGGTDGSGDYRVGMPLPINTLKHIPNSTEWLDGAPSPEGGIGQYRGFQSAGSGQLPSGSVFVFDANLVKASIVNDFGAGNSEATVNGQYNGGGYMLSATGWQLYFDVTYAGAGLSGVPLKDR